MTLVERDQAVIWHPFTQHQTAQLPLPIVSASGAYVVDEQGKRYLDLISSWWLNLHGHSHPEIAKAIYEQAMALEHVIFSGFTHEPAVSLAEKILDILPAGFSKVFYSDNGATSVEVALKMAYQYWRNQGDKNKKRFLVFEHGYHGDTFGGMSLGKTSGFYEHFKDLLFEVDTLPYPETWLGDELVEEKEKQVLNQLNTYLEKNSAEVAAFVIEPLVQGVAGMRMCTTNFLQQLEKMVRSYGVLVIYDEVMTGFGRTGEYFACLKANTTPDIICLSKGITGGFLPLAMTVCHEKIYEAFLGEDAYSALLHGHSYTANPLGCAAGLASLKLLKDPKTQNQIKMIEHAHQQGLTELSKTENIKHPRYCGTIAAFDLKSPVEYGSKLSLQLRTRFLEQGLMVRPLGDVIYFLPPYCISEAELKRAYDIVINEMQGVLA